MDSSLSMVSLITCHHVYVDPYSGNVTLLGIFTSLRATKFPSPIMDFCVYFMLEGDPALTGEIQLDLYASTTGEQVLSEKSRFQIGHEGKRHMTCRLSEFSFPHADRYLLQLSSQGELIAYHSFFVKGK